MKIRKPKILEKAQKTVAAAAAPVAAAVPALNILPSIPTPKVGGALGQVGNAIATAAKTVAPIVNPIGTAAQNIATGKPVVSGISPEALLPILSPAGAIQNEILKKAGVDTGIGSDPRPRSTIGESFETPKLPTYVGIESLGSRAEAGPYDTTFGIDRMKTMVDTASQDSPWVKMALEKQALDQQNAAQSAFTDAIKSGAQARAGLAARGGLRGGAGERLSRSSFRDAMLNMQDVNRLGMTQRQDIGLQGEGMRLDMLKQLPGAELASAGYRTGVDQFNIGNRITDLARRGEHERFGYGEGMRAKGAAMSAQAIENAGKK